MIKNYKKRKIYIIKGFINKKKKIQIIKLILKKKNRKEDYAQEQMPTHNVGTFMSLVDLVSVTFKNMPKREKKKITKKRILLQVD